MHTCSSTTIVLHNNCALKPFLPNLKVSQKISDQNIQPWSPTHSVGGLQHADPEIPQCFGEGEGDWMGWSNGFRFLVVVGEQPMSNPWATHEQRVTNGTIAYYMIIRLFILYIYCKFLRIFACIWKMFSCEPMIDFPEMNVQEIFMWFQKGDNFLSNQSNPTTIYYSGSSPLMETGFFAPLAAESMLGVSMSCRSMVDCMLEFEAFHIFWWQLAYYKTSQTNG